jgi:hypothetical protein
VLTSAVDDPAGPMIASLILLFPRGVLHADSCESVHRDIRWTKRIAFRCE